MSFAVGIADLGGSPLIISTASSQLGGKETASDTARVLERQVAAIVWRTYAQSGLEEMAAGTRVPVVNALSDEFHPCQLLADLLTIREHRGRLAGLTLTFFGDGASNMAHSYLLAGATAGCTSDRLARGLRSRPGRARGRPAHRGHHRRLGHHHDRPGRGCRRLDIVITDTWVSMGKEEEKAARVATFRDYRVDSDTMAAAASDALFLHCLPADRGYEVTAEVIDGPQSVIWDEAENRLHAQKALLVWLLERAGTPTPLSRLDSRPRGEP